MKEPTKSELRERIARQAKTIARLQEEIERRKKPHFFPEEARRALADQDAAITSQRQQMGKIQRQADEYRLALKAVVNGAAALMAVVEEAKKVLEDEAAV